jgi:DNA-binding transcriptional regulator YhcF (GntR family)
MLGLDLAVDRESEVPLGTQLTWKLRTLIGTGRLTPGDRVPGIREVAEVAGVNVNTVRSVFARLEEQGLLVTEQGRGTFVAPDVRPAAILDSMASAALAQAREAGIDPRELAAALYVNSSSAGAAGAREADQGRREERLAVRAEIVRLEREIGALDPLGPLETALGKSDPGAAPPRLLTLDELRQTRDGLTARVEELRAQRAAWLREGEELERAEEEASREAARRHVVGAANGRRAGIWTGQPHVRVSFTMP